MAMEDFPSVHELFAAFNELYFDSALGPVLVSWSSRMTLCAGLCYYSRQTRSCHIKLSQPILQYRPTEDLVDTLLHEMIHAYLFLYGYEQNRDGHGAQFQAWMQAINEKAGSRITVRHSFHEEVAAHRTHIWRCNGPCQLRPPFYGFVKRSMNRAPQAADWWYAAHRADCGGHFAKISSPPLKKQQSPAAGKKTEAAFDRSLDTTQQQRSPSSLRTCMSSLSEQARPFVPLQTVTCPACGQDNMEARRLNDHLDECLEPWDARASNVLLPSKTKRVVIEID